VISDVTAEVERTRLAEAAKEVLRKSELSLAVRLQTSLLPRDLEAPGLEVAARMLPAEEVGGDYYDVIPIEGGCWIGIGDVSGHGLSAGVIMLMVQSAVSALVRESPAAAPRRLVCALNAMVFDNIRQRLGDRDHVTLSLLRYSSNGELVIAGAHEDVIIHRAATGVCEVLPTEGTWLGGMPEIGPFTVDETHRLAPGDTLWLYTDGLTEAMNRGTREQFGLARTCRLLEEWHSEPVAVIRDRLFEALLAWSPVLADDVTILGMRYRGTP
jgi:sigma-B regulation protein RsbU (phosphoserine phosphatase)